MIVKMQIPTIEIENKIDSKITSPIRIEGILGSSTHTTLTTDESDESDGHEESNFVQEKTSQLVRNETSEVAMRSILKSNIDSHLDYVSFSKKSWRSLPAPEMEEMNNVVTSRQKEISSSRELKRAKSLSFDQIHIRYFDQTIGDHPNTSYGPPISLDWKYEDGESVFVEDYERNRCRRRNMRELMMNYYVRRNTLMWDYGFSEAEVKKATRNCEKVAFQRSVTKYFLPVSKVEEALQSASRKVKRVVKGENKSRSKQIRKLKECTTNSDGL